VSGLRGWIKQLRVFARKQRVEADLDEELAVHIEMETEKNIREGMEPAEARRAALVEFGGIERTKERVRDARWTRWLEDAAADVRYALRSLARTPMFTAVAVLTLALGIGANTAIFSVVDGVLVQPLPYEDANRIAIVRLGLQPALNIPGDGGLSEAEVRLIDENSRAFEAFAGWVPEFSRYALTGDGNPQEIAVARMDVGAFDLLGVRPLWGRLPTGTEGVFGTSGRRPDAEGVGGERVLLLSEQLWRSRYGSNPGVVGRRIDLNELDYEVIGVLPSGFDFPDPGIDAWIPIRLDPASPDWGIQNRLSGLARLAPGATLESARRDMGELIGRFDETGVPKAMLERYFDGSANIALLKETVVEDARLPLLIVMGTVGFVLLIACGNIANLLLVRAEARSRELAVRLALGSGRRRLIQHQLIESVLLALAGGAAGVALAYLGTRTLVWLAPASLPRLEEIGIRGSALWFTLAASLGTGLLVGAIPALRSTSGASLAGLRGGGRGYTRTRERHQVRDTLAVTQVALALVLVVGAGLMVRTFRALNDVQPGFEADHVLTFRVNPQPERHGGTRAGVARFYERLLARLDEIPGVEATGASMLLPLTGGGWETSLYIVDLPPADGEMNPVFKMRVATPGYFEAMGIPVLEGRTFQAGDESYAVPGPIIISHSLKQRYWPNESALGKRTAVAADMFAEAAVVGVVGDVHDTGLDSAADPMYYYPASDSMLVLGDPMSVVVRTQLDPASIVPDVRSSVAGLDPELPIADLRPMREIVADSISRTTFTMYMLTLAAAVALFLGAVGIYGVIAYNVRQRTSEIGIRVALGEDPARIRRGVLGRGLILAATGVALGLAAATVVGRTMASLLFGVSPLDVRTLLGGAALFLVVAGLASLLPSAKATRISPAEALRTE
jgi:predicted permease